jgi:hypothetical protein
MAEEVKKIKSKNAGFEYKLLNHADKLGLLLEAMLDYETVLFNHNINMLDENHSDYPAWKATKDEIIYPSMDPSIFELKYPNTDINGRITTY